MTIFTVWPVIVVTAAQIMLRTDTQITNCARGDTICLRPLQVDNIFAFIRQVAPVPARWLFKTSATSWPWKWYPSHVRRASVPILVFLGICVLELRPMYATDVRQTDVRQKHRLMPPPYGDGGIKHTEDTEKLYIKHKRKKARNTDLYFTHQ